MTELEHFLYIKLYGNGGNTMFPFCPFIDEPLILMTITMIRISICMVEIVSELSFQDQL